MALIYLVEDDDGIGEIESFALKNTGFDCDGCDVTGCRWFSYRERNP